MFSPQDLNDGSVVRWVKKLVADSVASIQGSAFSGSYNDLTDKPTIPTIPNLSLGTTSGNGNAITDVSVSGHEITLTKGSTFLTSVAWGDVTDKPTLSISNGTITIGSNSITPLTAHQSLSGYLPLTGGTMTGFITATGSTNSLQIFGGENTPSLGYQGAGLRLYGADYPDSGNNVYAGQFRIFARERNGNSAYADSILIGYPPSQGGYLTWRGTAVSLDGHTHTYASLTSTPTTLSGYGITDAKIDNGVITLGSNSITPITSHQSLSGYLPLTGGALTGALTILQENPGEILRFAEYAKGAAPDNAIAAGLYLRDKSNTNLGQADFLVRGTTSHVGSNFRITIRDLRTANASDNSTIFFAISANSSNVLTYAFRPNNSGISLGANNANYRWTQLYADTATISTSDERLKTNIAEYPDEVLDAWEQVNWYQFQFIDSVERKGTSARIHSGLIAQHIDTVFKQHGLNASQYGFFCHDSWENQPAEYDSDGALITEAFEAGDAYALRYEECFAIESACQRRRADRLEARIANLERNLL